MMEFIDYKWFLGGAAAFISFCNMLYYFRNVFLGKTNPHIYTWLIWGLVGGVVAVGQIVGGAGAGVILLLMATFNCFAIATLAFFKGKTHITKSDIICLVVCFIAMALWPITKIPLLSIVIVTFVDLVGYIPTIRKSYNNPHEENLFSFAIFILTVTLALLALENYTMLTMLYLLAMNVANTGMVILLVVRRRVLGYKVFA